MEPKKYGRTSIIERLTAEVEHSRAAYNEHSRSFHALIEKIPSGLPYPDGNFQLTQAGERFNAALRAYCEAVRRLDTFVRTGVEGDSGGEQLIKE